MKATAAWLLLAFVAASCSRDAPLSYRAENMVEDGVKFGNVYFAVAEAHLKMTDTIDGSRLRLETDACGGLVVEAEYLSSGLAKPAHKNRVSEGVFAAEDLKSYSVVSLTPNSDLKNDTRVTYITIAGADPQCAADWFKRSASRISVR